MRLYKSLLLLILLYSQNIFGQNFSIKYFIIDTVVFEKDVDKNELNFTDFFQDLLCSGNSGKVIIDTNILREDNTRLLSKITYIKGDSLKIGILIDDKRSVVWLNHLERLKDTVHIKKWTLFHNQLQDSIKSWIGFYHYIDDSIIGVYKQKSKQYVTNKNYEDEHPNVSFILNNAKYSVPLNINVDELVSWSHGYTTKNGEKKRYKKELAGKKNIRYNKFAASVAKKRKIYVGILDL